MLIRFLICFCCVFVLAGCVNNEAAMPVITHVGNAVIEPPPIIIPGPPKIYNKAPAGWQPPRHLEKRRQWRGIIVHHSASSYGCAEHEHKSHKANGWGGLGYHFVINNGVYRYGYGRPDGLVEVGYRWSRQNVGSHCRPKGDRSNYWNEHTIGICLIGDFEKTRPTQRQWASLVELIKFLQERYNIPPSQIQGHRDVKPTKCPGKNFTFGELRRRLSR